MNRPMTKQEWFEYLDKTWDAAQKEARAEQQEPVAWMVVHDKDAEIKRLNEKIEFLARTNMLYSDWEHRETQVTSDLIRKGIEATKIKASDEALMAVALEAIEGFIPYLPLDDTAQMSRYDQAIKGLTERLKEKNT